MEADIKEKVLFLRISKLYNKSMTKLELCEATRGTWKVGSRREGADYVFSVANGHIKEVYKIKSWLPAGSLHYETRSIVGVDGRWEFDGCVDAKLSKRYVNLSVKGYFKKGASNPVTYINC